MADFPYAYINTNSARYMFIENTVYDNLHPVICCIIILLHCLYLLRKAIHTQVCLAVINYQKYNRDCRNSVRLIHYYESYIYENTNTICEYKSKLC